MTLVGIGQHWLGAIELAVSPKSYRWQDPLTSHLGHGYTHYKRAFLHLPAELIVYIGKKSYYICKKAYYICKKSYYIWSRDPGVCPADRDRDPHRKPHCAGVRDSSGSVAAPGDDAGTLFFHRHSVK